MGRETIVDLFLTSAERYKDNTAFNYPDRSWKRVTYGDLLRLTRSIASYLIKSGMAVGSRAAIVSENRFEWCASYLGTLMAGGIAVPIDAQLRTDEIRNLIDDSGTTLIFHSSKIEENVKGPFKAINFDSPLFREICNTPHVDHYPDIAEEDIASILYTSGTTGRPKGVMLTHRNFCSDAKAVIDAGIVSHEDNILSILPLHHTYPFMCTFIVPVFLGAAVTFPPGLKGPELLSTMKETAVTIFVAVPQLLELMRDRIIERFKEMPVPVSALLHLLLRLCGKSRRIADINIGKLIFRLVHKEFGEGFRFFASGGARLDPMVMTDLEALGFTVLEGYGLTETSPVVTFNPIRKRKPGSAGKPLPSVEIKIVDTSGTGQGEIAIKGPMVMKGYYKNPEATQQVIRDGWFMSGDIGYMDEEGYLFITGRVKEVIVLSSGKNVFPEEVEREYLKIPLIKEICVLGIEERGVVESLYGIVVADLDYARAERIGNLYEFLRWAINQVSARLPAYMRIKGFTLYTEPLPKTPLGKLKRYVIKDMLKEAKGKRPEPKEEDKVLLGDPVGRVVVGCIMPLLREKIPIHSSDNLELDLGLDSLRRIEMIVAIEKAFSIKLSETFASEVHTVGEVVSKVKELCSGGVIPDKKPLWRDIFTSEPSDMEKKTIGLSQGKAEWLFSAIIVLVLRLTLRLLFRLEVKGIEKFPSPPFIIAPNHCSNMDGFVVAAAVPLKLFRTLYFQGFQKYFRGWLPSRFARLAHVIPIDPEIFLTKALQFSSYILRNNKCLCIFPEGGRSFDGKLMDFKKGIGILAVEHEVPVVPALIEGTFDALPRGAIWPRFTKIKITFGKPLYPSGLDRSKRLEGVDDYQLLANEVREKVKMLKK